MSGHLSMSLQEADEPLLLQETGINLSQIRNIEGEALTIDHGLANDHGQGSELDIDRIQETGHDCEIDHTPEIDHDHEVDQEEETTTGLDEEVQVAVEALL